MSAVLQTEHLEAIRRLGTCTVANAIETFDVRLRNEGFANASIRCIFPELSPMLGYAATLRIRCSSPPPDGGRYFDCTDWWDYILSIPEPRVLVIEDMDQARGLGSFLGEVHANILLALGCVGAVTNGSVRDVPAVLKTGFHFFASSLSVSHAYAHIVDFGQPVKIGGLKVLSGDLLHGDIHGILSIPGEIAAGIPERAGQILVRERRLITLCESKNLALGELREAVQECSSKH